MTMTDIVFVTWVVIRNQKYELTFFCEIVAPRPDSQTSKTELLFE